MTATRRVTRIPLWDGQTARGPATVTWTGDRIDSVEVDAPDAASAAAASPYSVIPGLIDTHVHLDTNVVTGGGPGDAWPLATPPEEKAMHVLGHAQRFAKYGVTTLRDLAASPVQIAVGRALDEGAVPGPRLLAAGPVGMTAGHGDLFTPPRFRGDRPPVADTPDECRRLVRFWAREGATAIKIYTSGGILSMGDQVGWRNQTSEEIRASVDEAHALNLRVASHSHTAAGIDIALDAGVDSIEHATGIRPDQFDRLLDSGVSIAPTLLINDIVARGGNGMRRDAAEKARAAIAGRDEAFLAAGAAGIRFVLGTDANGTLVRHGDQLTEVRMMQDAFGWGAERALVAATSDAADAVGLGDRVGRIVPGYGADLVVVRGRPWEDLEALAPENIVAVVSRGVVIAGMLPAD